MMKRYGFSLVFMVWCALCCTFCSSEGALPRLSCAPGEQSVCACANGASNLQVCLSDGTYGPCACASVEAGVAPRLRDECRCDLDLSAAEWTTSLPTYSGNTAMSVSGYEIFNSLCDITQASSQGEQVDMAFACQPIGILPKSPVNYYGTYSGPSPIEQTSWIAIRRTFSTLQDLSCCNAISLQVKLDTAMGVECNCSIPSSFDDANPFSFFGDAGAVDAGDAGDAGNSYLSSCCFGTVASDMKLRVALNDVAQPKNIGQLSAEGWWYDFPVTTLQNPFDWTTLTAPISGFYQSAGLGTSRNNDKLDLANILGVEVDILISVGTYLAYFCENAPPHTCTLDDNYYGAHVSGGLSFRTIKTACQ
jgi:hypothetical protein